MTGARRFAVPLCLVQLCFALLGAWPARAHPHVWVSIRSELVYAADGTVQGVRHAWTFDEMFSSFAIQGIEPAHNGVFTRQDLAALAEVNVTSLKEYDYFTRAKADGKKAPFTDPTDYWLEFAGGALTLHFMLPLKAPVKAKTLTLEIYDPTWFVDFSFAQSDPVSIAAAPRGCKLELERPQTAATAQVGGQQSLGEAFFNGLGATSNFGARFANRARVMCP